MKCTNCGAEIAEGSMFCTSCGTPVQPVAAAPNMPGPDDPTVLLDPSVANAAPMNMQVDMQPQTQAFAPQGQTAAPSPAPEVTPIPDSSVMSNPFGQPVPPQPQPMQQMQQPFGQPMQQPQVTGQPFGQPMQQPQVTGQPFGQPVPPQQMQQMQQPYGQPMQQPKPPKKPLSPGAKKAILFSAIGAVVIAAVLIVLLVILPKTKKSSLRGSYIGKDSYDDTYTYVLDDGTYIMYEGSIEDNNIWEAGNYELDGDKLTFTDLEGMKTAARYSKSDNSFSVDDWGDTTVYNSADKSASIPFSLSSTYSEELRKKAQTAADVVCATQSNYDYLSSSGVYIWNDNLKDPYNQFYADYAEAIEYSSDKALQVLMEGGYIEIDIDMENGKPVVSFWIY